MATVLAEVAKPPDARTGCEERTGSSPNVDVELIDPLLDQRWDKLVRLHPAHTFFHSTAWARVLCGTYGHKPFYFQLSAGGKLLALVPLLAMNSRVTGRRAVCLPFSDYCAPLTFGESATAAVEDRLSRMAREQDWKYVELRGSSILRAEHSSEPTFYGHVLDLRGGIEQLLSGFDTSVRRALRKAKRSNLTVRTSDAWDSVKAFYHLHARTRRRHGVPPQPISFFRHIHETVIKGGFGFTVEARVGSRPIAAAIFFHFGNSALYKFGASDERFHVLRANNLVMVEGIKGLATAGAHTLHFGRTGLEQDGLRRYKLGWGTKEVPIYYRRINGAKNAWDSVRTHSSGFHERIFRALPLALNRLAGTMIYPHLD